MKNEMKRIFEHIILCLSAAVLWACSGQVDPEVDNVLLTLTADRTEVVADGESEVVFTVMHGVQDVTSVSKITCTSGNASVKGNVFVPLQEGTYVFTASYEGKTSEGVTVTVMEPVASRFERHVCVMEFTGTWCSQCPSGATAITYLVEEAYKGKAFAMAFHNDDIYEIPQEKELYNKFPFSGYPGFVTDMRDYGNILDGGCSTSIERSLYETETHCGASLKCMAVENSDGTVKVTADARMFSEKTMNYRMAAYVIEDKVVGEQKLGNNDIDESYVHRHVVRQMLSASIAGDDLGSVSAGMEAARTYEFTSSNEWNSSNLSVAVLVIDDAGRVNNMAICSCMNGEMDYEYAE